MGQGVGKSKFAMIWQDLSLAAQFALAGGIVMVVSGVLIGNFVANRVEEVVTRNAANATAHYMESFLAPLAQGLVAKQNLDAEAHGRIAKLLRETALGARVVSFKIWREGGLVIDSSNPDVIGKRFEVSESLRLAWRGEVRAELDDTVSEESTAERALGIPLLEIYSPIRDVSTGKVIAIAEFYEDAVQLKSDLWRIRAMSWGAVAALMALIGTSLFFIVLRGSRTIDTQVRTLKSMSERNLALRLRVQNAAVRFSTMHDQSLRRIGSDIHDGPVQLIGFAALRLDALKDKAADESLRVELQTVQSAVKDAIKELRGIARGFALPDVEHKTVEDLLAGLVDAHTARTGAEVIFLKGDRALPDLPTNLKVCCYRFAQEGLNNGWHHGQGLGQELRLSLEGDHLSLVVLDRGPGFGKLPLEMGDDQMRLGLAGLCDRVESLGGRVVIANRTDGPGAELRMELELNGDI